MEMVFVIVEKEKKVLTMTEYIEREAISEEIRKYYYKNPPNFSYGEGFDRGLDRAQRAILDAPSADVAPVQKWISVKDRLPEEEGLYLVAVVNDHERRYSKTAWYHGHGNWFLHQKVTHWMPLPEPPKEEW